MKKLFLLILCLAFLPQIAEAKIYKITAVALTPYSSENPSGSFEFASNQNCKLDDGRVIPENTVFKGTVVSNKNAAIGKTDASFKLKLLSYELPGQQPHKVKNPEAVVKITNYVKPKSINKEELAWQAGKTAAGLFVDNIATPLNIVQGMIDADEGSDITDRAESGLKNAYNKSLLSYTSKGKSINFSQGDIITVTVNYSSEH